MSREQDQLIDDSHSILERTGASIQRSNQIAIENEQIATEVLSDLVDQRESLLRSSRRLQDADEDLSKSRAIIRRLRRDVIYNKVVLILIIIVEIIILIAILVIKLIRF